MTAEHDRPHPLDDPKAFLDRPFERLEVAVMGKPTKEFLQWTPSHHDEAGIYLYGDTWYVIKASDWGVPTWMMPETADILGHSHSKDEDEEENDGSIPSLNDLLNASPTSKNYIFSVKGITRYWRVEDEGKRRELERARDRGEYGKGTKKTYLPFLERMNARYEVKPWDEISDEIFSQMFKKL